MTQKKMKTTEYQTRVGEIYTTGASCSPMRLYIPSSNKDEWIWRVNGFECDSYMDGHYVDPADSAATREKLITEFSHEPEEKTVLTFYPIWIPADKSPSSRRPRR